MTAPSRDLRALGVASAGACVAALSTSVVAVGAPVVAADLRVSVPGVSVVLSAYLLVVSCLLPLAGRLGDTLGKKRVYVAGLTLFALGSAACALAPTLGALVAARALQATGAACTMAVGPAIVTGAFPPAERARALGAQLTATYLGLTAGPTVGGLVAGAFGWRAIFVVVAVAGVSVAALAFVTLPRVSPAAGARRTALDLGGALLFALSLGALLGAMRVGPREGWASPRALAGIATAVVALALFARHEARHEAPLIPPSLVRSRPLALGVLGALLLYAVLFISAFLLPFFLQRAHGMSPGRAGLLMTAQPAAMAVTAPLSGVIADRRGARVPIVVGMVVLAAGLALLAWSASPPLVEARVVVALAVMGVGAGLYVAPNNAVIMGAAPRERQGMAAAIAATARNVGMTLGIAIAATVEAPLGFRGALALAAGVACVGAVMGGVGRGARVT